MISDLWQNELYDLFLSVSLSSPSLPPPSSLTPHLLNPPPPPPHTHTSSPPPLLPSLVVVVFWTSFILSWFLLSNLICGCTWQNTEESGERERERKTSRGRGGSLGERISPSHPPNKETRCACADAHFHCGHIFTTSPQAILRRRLNVPELHELLLTVQTMSITAEAQHVRAQCREVSVHSSALELFLTQSPWKHSKWLQLSRCLSLSLLEV